MTEVISMQISKDLASTASRKVPKGNHVTAGVQISTPLSASGKSGSVFEAIQTTVQRFQKGMFKYDVLHSHSSLSTMMTSGHSSTHWSSLYLPVPIALHWAQSRYRLHLLGQFWEIQMGRILQPQRNIRGETLSQITFKAEKKLPFVFFFCDLEYESVIK